jgi:hypothetical protein
MQRRFFFAGGGILAMAAMSAPSCGLQKKMQAIAMLSISIGEQ